MKILFSNPPWWARDAADGALRGGIRAGSRWPFTMRTNSRPGAPVLGEYMPFPMFLGFAAAYCAQALPFASVVMRDSIARRESYEEFLAYVTALRPDWLVLETATPSWSHDRTLLNVLCRACPGMKVIVTGTITTTRHAELNEGGFFTIAGEYEKGVVEVVRNPQAAPCHVPHQFLTEAEMNCAPFPMFDEPVALSYFDACPKPIERLPGNPEATRSLFPELTVWTTRGCTFRCSFCAWPAVMTNDDATGAGKRVVRFYGAQYVEEQIRRRLEKNPGIRSIRLDDDTVNFGDRHTIAISQALGRIGLPWSAMCRADTISGDTWAIMQGNGCFGVKIGMESGSARVVNKIIGKRLDLEKIEDVTLPLLKALGLSVHTTWTIGLPGETPEEQAMTEAMIERLYAKGLHTTHQLSGTATIEGTPLDTLQTLGTQSLKAYPEARLSPDFIRTGDGQAKVEFLHRNRLQAPKS